MRTDIVTAPEDSSRESLKRLFTRYNLQMIPIVDAEKRIKRVVTKEDIAGNG